MPFVTIDDIATRYEVVGSGPPILMFAPGGFDASLDKWSTSEVYARLKVLDHVAKEFTCILFDRRETGQSGGRVERITWAHYVRQGAGLLDHLGIERAHVMGGCMGCCPVAAFGVAHPRRALSLTFYWPVGGAKFRIRSHLRFAEHLAFVQRGGLGAVVDLATTEGKAFGTDPRVGPWAPVIRRDAAFAAAYRAQDVERYKVIVAGMARDLFDRDTALGAEPEDMMTLDIPAFIVPGHDPAHATSAARYLEECLPRAEYWDIAVEQQTEAVVPPRMVEWLARVGR